MESGIKRRRITHDLDNAAVGGSLPESARGNALVAFGFARSQGGYPLMIPGRSATCFGVAGPVDVPISNTFCLDHRSRISYSASRVSVRPSIQVERLSTGRLQRPVCRA